MSGARRDFFVTGTDTGVGKTLVSVALLRTLRRRGLAVAGMKPVAAGAIRGPAGLRNDDALALAAEGSRAWPYEVINPWCFEPAIAPHIAAAEAAIEVGVGPVEAAFRRLQQGTDVVIVEGAGGFLVPLGPRISFGDLPQALGLEIVLVVGLRLGCLNHALLTVESIEQRGLHLAGWVGNCIDPDFGRPAANIDTLRSRIPAPCLGVVPHRRPPDADVAADALDGPDTPGLKGRD